jgi:hypothetical protein
VRPSREKLDFSVYLRAFGVFARNPTVIVLPLVAGVVGILVNQVSDFASGDGGVLQGLTTFILLLLQLFALGVSVIIADMGWRRGQASFDDAWQDARRKGRDILFAAFGFTFILNVAQYAGTIVGPVVGIILLAIAGYGLIYTIPAAAIGGIPGGAAISVSIERVRSAPLAAALLTAITLVVLFYVGGFIDMWAIQALGITSLVIAEVLGAVLQAILTGYIAVVMAKVYTDVSFTTPRW